jgi:hypothetical protein
MLVYDSSTDLAAALGRLPLAPAEPSVVARRFGPERFMAALEAAAGR